ncbi:P27 family phage terminase small subunit [Pseudarthrobacter oxydans]|uniref:P27 family phage terminase small subunit n=1 Tax=Pseudarthrobacter oxydans TaxID=1671 RepID=UPI003422C06D
MARKPALPVELGKRGKAYYSQILEDYELEESEVQILLEAARTLDEVEALKAAVSELGVTTKGSTGQVVVNPALAEMRQARAMFARLVHQLDLPADEEDEEDKSPAETAAQRDRTENARKAANARWSMDKAKRGTRGA